MITIQGAIDQCIDVVYAGLARTTARTYETGLRRFADFLDSKDISTVQPLADLSINHFIQFQSWLIKHYSKRTAGVYSSAGKRFLDWLVINGHLHLSYDDSLRYQMAVNQISRKREELLPRFPGEDDIAKMLSAVRRVEWNHKLIRLRNISLLEFLASTGCRISEACDLTIKDIDGQCEHAIVRGKGSKERVVYINRPAREALMVYWGARGYRAKSDPVFARHDRRSGNGQKIHACITSRTGQTIVRAVADEAGVDPITPHYFRHDFAIKALQRTGDLAVVQDLLGHASPATTRIYAKIRPKNLEEAHKRIFGEELGKSRP